MLWLVAITNKMQLSNGILLFHSTLIVQHVSSVVAHHQEPQLYLQLLVYIRLWRPPVVPSEWELQFPLRRHHGRSPQAYVNQKMQIQLRFLMMSDITLETCWTINVLWNNKIPLLSCILLVIATSQILFYSVSLILTVFLFLVHSIDWFSSTFFTLPNCYLPFCSPTTELPLHLIVLLIYALKELYLFVRCSWTFCEDSSY